MGRNNTQFFQVVKEQEYDVASILKDVYEALKEKGYKYVYAVICDNNEVSIKFHEAMGFKKAGHLENAGYKMSKWIGVYFYVLQIASLDNIKEPF